MVFVSQQEQNQMIRFLIVTALALFATAAQASGAPQPETGGLTGSLFCHAPRLLISSGQPHPNPIITSDVNYYHGHWQVLHHLADGAVIARSNQYHMVDDSHGNILQWSGFMLRNSVLLMKGNAWANPQSGEAGYDEWIFDTSHDNRVEMHSTARCRALDEGDGDTDY
jgi:hypothetical protein